MNFGQYLGLILLILLGYELWQVRKLLLLLFMAVVLANALTLLIRRFQRWGLRRSQAVILALVTLLLGLAGSIWLIVPPFVAQFQELVRLVPQGLEQLLLWLDQLTQRLDPSLVAALPNLKELAKPLQSLINPVLGRSLTVFYGSLGTVLSLLLLIVLAMMLLADPTAYRQGFIRLFPAFYRSRIDFILQACEESLQSWLGGMVINMSLVAVVSGLGLLILQIPLALAQALLTGLLAFIPNLGLIISIIPPLALALLAEPWQVWGVLILYIGIQQLESQLLTPRLMRQQISFLPGLTLTFQVLLAIFFGFIGLCLAFPLSLIGQIWIREVLIRDIFDRWRFAKDEFAIADEPDVTPSCTAESEEIPE